jgi:hypothetical protein
MCQRLLSLQLGPADPPFARVTLDELSDETSLLATAHGGVSTGRFVGSRVHHRFAETPCHEVARARRGPTRTQDGEGHFFAVLSLIGNAECVDRE